MQTQTDKTKEQQNDAAPRVQQEHSTGGTATIVDNRPSTIYQRKLHETMNASAADKANPIQRKANNTGLPDNLKAGIENLSGHAMDDVKVHYNSGKPAQLQAHAYAQGTDIHLAPGQEKHLPHEAWHVVQQKQGRVKPTKQLKSKVNINDDAGLEKEADVMGKRSIQPGNGEKTFTSLNQSSVTNHGVAQRYIYDNRDNDEDGYEAKENIARINPKGNFELRMETVARDIKALDQSDLKFLVDKLWNDYGTTLNKDINMQLISQILKDMGKSSSTLKFTDFEPRLEFYKRIQQEGFKNRGANSIILGRYMPQVNNDQGEWWFRGPGSYIHLAGNAQSMYFDLGAKWDKLIGSKDHDIDNEGLFNIFNTHVLDYAVSREIDIIFVDHPEQHRGSSLHKEWLYLEERHGFKTLYADGGGRYIARKEAPQQDEPITVDDLNLQEFLDL